MMSIDKSATTRVRATYEHSEILFDISPTATLAQVAAMLATAGRGHGAPVSVEVVIEPAALRA